MTLQPANLVTPRTFRLFCSVLAAGVFAAGLLWVLISPGAPFQTRPLIRKLANAHQQPAVPLGARVLEESRREHRATFRPVGPVDLGRCRSLVLQTEVYDDAPDLFGTPTGNLALESAEIRDGSGTLIFRPSPGARIVDNGFLEFFREGPARDGIAVESLELRLVVPSPKQIALWCRGTADPPSAEIGQLRLDRGTALTSAIPATLYLMGGLTYALDSPPLARWRLLAFMWDLPGGARPLGGLLAFAVGLVGVGVYLLGGGARPWRVGCGAAGFFGGIGLGYLVCVPPFQGPDEPVHLLSYAGYTRDPELTADSLRYAQRGHFERIKFRLYQHFSHLDMEAPSALPWAEHINTNPMDMRPRSAVTCRIWDLFQWVAPRGSAPRVFLALRLVDLGIVCLGVGVGAWLLAGTLSPGEPGAGVILPIFLIPSLPFFSMIVSNYGALVSAGLVVAAAVAAQWMARRPDPRRGLALGLGTSLAILTSRSAIPLLGFVGVWLMAGVVAAIRPADGELETGSARLRLQSWLGLAVGALLPWLLITSEYGATFLRAGASARLPMGSFGLAGVMMLLGLAALAGVERWLLAKARPWLRRALDAVSRTLFLPAAGLGVWMVAFLVLPLPTVGQIEDGASLVSNVGYVGRTLAAMAASFGPGGHDFLVSLSFWCGFGWLDAIPPAGLVSVLCVPFALGLILALVTAARRRDGGSFVQFAGWAVGLCLYLAGMALGTFGERINLHGRYLIVFYLLALLVAATGWRPLFQRWQASHPRSLALVLALAPVLLHAGCLGFILRRYF